MAEPLYLTEGYPSRADAWRDAARFAGCSVRCCPACRRYFLSTATAHYCRGLPI